MASTEPSWDMTGMTVLLPWGSGHKADAGEGDDVRCGIEQLGGKIAYALPPKPPYCGAYGKDPAKATHEYVPDGAAPTTVLPMLTPGEFRSRRDAAHREYAEFLGQHARTAHVPVVTRTAQPGQESRYFGRPWMPEDMEWPELNGEPMNFVLQLDISAMPGAPADARKGLVLFFHAEEYDEDQSHVVLVDAGLPGGLRETPDGARENPPLAIVSWRAVTDYPWGDTLDEMEGYEKFDGVSIGFGSSTIGVARCADGKDRREKEVAELGLAAVGHCFECDKLGGWPRWEQGDDTPEDSEGNPMEFLMQVGHEGLLLGDFDRNEIDWPTWGRGQIFVSPATGEFKYVWACD